MDIATIAGLAVAAFAIFGGFLMEGGHITAILQPTAGLIVLGGTAGAVCVQFSVAQLKRAVRGAAVAFRAPKEELPQLVGELVSFAQKARREGVVSLEAEADKVADPFLKKALGLAVDGSDSKVIRQAMEVELGTREEEGVAGAKVFEAAGGYSPTVGILGAVLGLIHVMQNLTDPGKLGAGIAVAFVATVYGVAFANILFLPLAGKLKARHDHEMTRLEAIITGVSAIVDGENPRIIEEKLRGFYGGSATAETGGRATLRRAA